MKHYKTSIYIQQHIQYSSNQNLFLRQWPYLVMALAMHVLQISKQWYIFTDMQDHNFLKQLLQMSYL